MNKPFKAFIIQFSLELDGEILTVESDMPASNHGIDHLPQAFLKEKEAVEYINDNLGKLNNHKNEAWVIVKKSDEGNGSELLNVRFKNG